MNKAKFRAALDELVKLRDEVHLQGHLLSLESRQRLDFAERRLLEMEDRLRQTTEPLSAAAHRELDQLEAEAKSQINELAQELRECAKDGARKAGTSRANQPIRRRRIAP